MHQPHAGVGVPVNAALVPLGQAKGALQAQVVDGEVEVVPACEQADDERHHRLGHVLCLRGLLLAKTPRDGAEPLPPGGAGAGRRVEGVVDPAQPVYVVPDRAQLVAHLRGAAFDAAVEATQRPVVVAPFFSIRARPMESRTSPRASAIRTPGGCNGPPWSSFKMPRTAAQ
jgi:hypothetical protein